jgi:hypothetical protein
MARASGKPLYLSKMDTSAQRCPFCFGRFRDKPNNYVNFDNRSLNSGICWNCPLIIIIPVILKDIPAHSIDFIFIFDVTVLELQIVNHAAVTAFQLDCHAPDLRF